MSSTTVPTELPPNEVKKLEEDDSANLNPPKDVPCLNALFKAMKVDELYRTDVGSNATIDVQPDFRYITLQLVEHSVKIYEQIKQLCVPSVTPASILAYFLDSIYTYGAINDVWHVRECTSSYAVEFLNQSFAEQSLTNSMFNAIPPIIRDIIKQLEYTFDPRRKNLAYIYSFAAFHFNTDCGRAYPIHMFMALHNMIAEATPNDTDETIWIQWLNYVVIRTATENITVAHLIGGGYANYITENFVTKSLRKLLSPLAQNGRPFLEPYQFDIPTQPGDEIDRVNPYFYLLGNTLDMVPTFQNFRNMMRSIVYDLFPKSIPLWTVYGSESGSTIMNHCYTTPTVPTFHNIKTGELTPKSSSRSASEYATNINFKCTWKCNKKAEHPVKWPESESFTPAYYLRTQSKSTPLDMDSYLASELDPNSSPWIIYSPWSPGKASTFYPVTSGLIVETFEIDGSHVPQPAMQNSIHDENSHFLESAVPILATTGRKSYDAVQAHVIRKRTTERRHRTKVCFSKYDMTVHQLPVYANSIRNAAYPTAGFHTEEGIQYPTRATTKIAYNGNVIPTLSKPESFFPYKLHAWSSYRWIPRKHSVKDDFINYAYFLVNFRTIYGTFPQTMMSENLPRLIEEY